MSNARHVARSLAPTKFRPHLGTRSRSNSLSCRKSIFDGTKRPVVGLRLDYHYTWYVSPEKRKLTCTTFRSNQDRSPSKPPSAAITFSRLDSAGGVTR